ncbi:hypothetical protein [Halalkalibacterium ligniniphilum]|uniref:hypothetical protein n=1 Tax=Halalkalibacterium ligniniphilum TaxID=1134413 RepID=UPI0003828726|nr:hypothetical protein [Halalkalibacterium ligniniphilum]
MKASELIRYLQKAIELHGDKSVWVDCAREGLSSNTTGVYVDSKNDVIRIGDENFEDIKYFTENEYQPNYKVIELER